MFITHRQVLSIFLMVCAFSTCGQTFMGTAIDKNESNAKKLAIADLQQNLYVQVETKSITAVNSNRPNFYRLTSKLSSNLPILGANPNCVKKQQEFHCQVGLETSSSELYRSTIVQNLEEIEQSWLGLKNARVSERFDGLTQLNQKYEQLKPLFLVYRLLAPNNDVPVSKIGLTPSQIQTALHDMQKNPTSIEMLALAIAEQYRDKQRIFVKPFSVFQSMQVTPFAKTLHNHLSSRLNTINDKDYAYYVLSGSYQFDQQGIQVQSTLTSLTREDEGLIAGATTNYLPLQYAGKINHQPTELNFDQLLQQGQILSNDLNAKLHTNLGDRDLLFTQGQSVKLLVKVNHPAYYYLLGHSSTGQMKNSYLLDLNDAEGPEKFVQYLGYEQVNRWVEIGEFDVHPPFGTETLQLFASTDDPKASLPSTRFDGTYYKISGDQKQVVNKTRGLVRKRQPTNTNQKTKQVAEAVLRFTTSLK